MGKNKNVKHTHKQKNLDRKNAKRRQKRRQQQQQQQQQDQDHASHDDLQTNSMINENVVLDGFEKHDENLPQRGKQQQEHEQEQQQQQEQHDVTDSNLLQKYTEILEDLRKSNTICAELRNKEKYDDGEGSRAREDEDGPITEDGQVTEDGVVTENGAIMNEQNEINGDLNPVQDDGSAKTFKVRKRKRKSMTFECHEKRKRESKQRYVERKRSKTR